MRADCHKTGGRGQRGWWSTGTATGRQQQLQTRLKSTCRRATSRTRHSLQQRRAAQRIRSCGPLCHVNGPAPTPPGHISARNAGKYAGDTEAEWWTCPPDPSPCPPPRSPTSAAAPFGIYVHVPFCATRCGYCDFNTYTAAELAAPRRRRRDGYAGAADRRSSRLAARVLGRRPGPSTRCSSAAARRRCSAAARPRRGARRRSATSSGSRRGAEVTTEANPESVDRRRPSPRCARPASPGCRSACSRRRRTCSRSSTARHTPGRAPDAVRARRARPGFEHVNLDLIYGTPGETDDDLAAPRSTRPSTPASTTSRRTR